jgi:site-specific recombinase XerD
MEITKHIERYRKDLEFKNYSKNSIENYVSQVSCFLNYFNGKFTDASRINESSIKDWLMQANTINSRKHRMCAVKLFYIYTIKQPLKFKHIEYPRSEKKLPRIIDKDFLLTKISNIENTKHRAIITIAYSVGLRVSEVCNLKIKDIDSKRMLIIIRQSKGNKDRLAPLSNNVLHLLRKYFTEFKPKDFLFEGQFGNRYSERSCQQLVKLYLGNDFHFHLLRHSSFTSMLEAGVDLRLIQKVAGHSSIKTTTIYTHVSTQLLNKIATPI